MCATRRWCSGWGCETAFFISGIAERWAGHYAPGGPGMIGDGGYQGTGPITPHKKPPCGDLSNGAPAAKAGWVGPGRPVVIAHGGFPRPARRTRRARLRASGAPRVLPVGQLLVAAAGFGVHGVVMVLPRQR
jgi:hypothetical protein